MYGFIYLTTCKVNNKKYIGLCSHEKIDKEKYLGSGTYLKNAIKRYGKSNFIREILEECATKNELDLAEAKWIAYYDATNNPEFYNLAVGGYGGDSTVIKTIWNKRSTAERKAIGNKVSKTRKEKIANGTLKPRLGLSTSHLVQEVWNNRSEERKKEIGNKVSATKKRLGIGKGKTNPMYGRSAITEKNLKWYTNGKENKYITEDTQPYGFVRGRTNLSGKIGRKTNEII
jgi:hypothetical protein